MYMMFIYIDGNAYNSMGIREDDVFELYNKAAEVTKEILNEKPHSTVEVKVTKYI